MIDDRVGAAGSPRRERGYINETPTDRPITEVLKEIAANVQEMVRSEIRLARAEISEETKKSYQRWKVARSGCGAGCVGGGFRACRCRTGTCAIHPDLGGDVGRWPVSGDRRGPHDQPGGGPSWRFRSRGRRSRT